MNLQLLKDSKAYALEKIADIQAKIKHQENNLKWYEEKLEKRLATHGNDRSAKAAARAIKNTLNLIEELKAKIAEKLEFIAYVDAQLVEVEEVKTYNFNAVEMSRNLTLYQLQELLNEVTEQHRKTEQQRQKEQGEERLQLIDKKGRWKCDQITWAMYYITKKQRKLTA